MVFSPHKRTINPDEQADLEFLGVGLNEGICNDDCDRVGANGIDDVEFEVTCIFLLPKGDRTECAIRIQDFPSMEKYLLPSSISLITNSGKAYLTIRLFPLSSSLPPSTTVKIGQLQEMRLQLCLIHKFDK
ncbi:hypothetical protein GOP47_0018040 [Adiantum capillus-veneris]|uniref:Uncharacterized protein n=1 Tax=Adiantum capillus-veneris TaxID=13818 RepID=A0A9D4UH10_ADICA|nr:hypothetical protein GOP47_0018040 [Adiantum capillus-veneris]